MMRLEISDDQYVLTLSRNEFLLLVATFNEHLLLRGHRFDVLGHSPEEGDAFLDELSHVTEQARLRVEKLSRSPQED